MMLSHLAQDFAAEIAYHDWSDAPWRLDRAGHRREFDPNRQSQLLSQAETECVRTNVMWVVAQVLKYEDPNLDLQEFAEACGVPLHITRNRDGRPSGTIPAGIRMENGQACQPGAWTAVSR